jgi:alanine racemase
VSGEPGASEPRGRALARIDLGAVEGNCARLRAALTEGSRLCAVVKADGYGHGALDCGGAALRGGAEMLAVAAASEAAGLRAGLPEARLLTMGALTPGELELALEAGSEVAVWRAGFLRLVEQRARASGRPARVHVKHDSGMGRLGSPDPYEVMAVAKAAAASPDLELAGVWTHFATADEPGSGFFDTQLDRFSQLAHTIKGEFPGVAIHAANSAATLRDPRSHFDMVRCGIGVYGLDPFGEDPEAQGLEPALELHSYVADVKHFTRGDSAGYGRTWQAPEDTFVGVLPIGYGDGVRRGLSNNAEVLVGGRRRPVVGTVSMDNITVDLGPHTDVAPGAPAVLIGGQGGERVTAEEWARRLGTINYEVTCGISPRVPRAVA